jgi:DNA-nicking Smr family endonuclease
VHGLHAPEAISVLARRLRAHTGGVRTVDIITGHGKHSAVTPSLLPTVRKYLTDQKLTLVIVFTTNYGLQNIAVSRCLRTGIFE